MIEELSLEDRINDEVRIILEAYSDEMRNRGANYQEMFKKVKNELVRKYKAVL
jgi:capsid protein